MKDSMSELFPGCEALMEDVEINNNVTVPAEDVEQAEEAGVVEGETQAAEAAEIESEAAETEVAATAFARQFGELCDMQTHIETYGVDRTFLALCNKNNILGRAFGIQMPACESFDTVGSPCSPLSIACVEAMGDSLWQKFKEWVKTIWERIKNFFTRIADWFREMLGNYNLRINKYKKWLAENKDAPLLTKDGKVSDKEVILPVSQDQGYSKQYEKVCGELTKLFNNKEWQDCINNINAIVKSSMEQLQQHGDFTGQQASQTVDAGIYNGNGGGDPDNGAGFSAYDPNKKEQKATDKLLEQIEKSKKKIKEKDLFKNKKVKLSEAFKNVDPKVGGARVINEMNSILDLVVEVVKNNESFERTRQSFSNAVSNNMAKLNSEIQRNTGGSIGARSRKMVSNNVEHIRKVVFKSGIVPTLNNKLISEGFKKLGMLRNCLSTSGDENNNDFNNK